MTKLVKVEKGEPLNYERKETLNEMFWNTVNQHPDVNAIGYWEGRELRYLTYQQFGERVKEIAKGLIELGIEKGDRIAIYADTRYEWELIDFASLTIGAMVVTIHSVLNRQQVEYILKDSGSRLVFTEKEYIHNLEGIDTVEGVVTIDEYSELDLSKLEKIGRGVSDDEYEERWRDVKPEDVASIVYTSGTTGEPKGAMLTHWNWRFNTMAVMSITPFYPGEPHICYLPLSHIYQRLVFFAGVSRAATAVFCSPTEFLDTARAIKPVGLIVVPRILERVNKGMLENAERMSDLGRRTFHWARNLAIECGKRMSRGENYGILLSLQRYVADKLVYSKIREGLGLSRARFVCSSAAELQKELAYMFNGMGIPVIEGYGMTETAAPSNLNPVRRFKPGTVGPPIPGVEVAIAEDGEILIKGDNVMTGYWNKPDETEKVFTDDGWLKTGDLGYFDEDGYLIFFGRKKHIIVLDTGKNVSPVPIEEELMKNPYVSDVILIGDGRPYITALIQPEFRMLLDLADKSGISYDKSKTVVKKGISGEEEIVEVDEVLTTHPKILEFYSEIVDDVNRKLAMHERIKRFRIISKAFSIERGEITPTLKKRRHVILENFERVVEEMYA